MTRAETAASIGTQSFVKQASADCVVGNRMLFIECDPKHCPCGERCTNRAIARGVESGTEPFWTGHERCVQFVYCIMSILSGIISRLLILWRCSGWGLRATEAIPRGRFIIEYKGEVHIWFVFFWISVGWLVVCLFVCSFFCFWNVFLFVCFVCGSQHTDFEIAQVIDEAMCEERLAQYRREGEHHLYMFRIGMHLLARK